MLCESALHVLVEEGVLTKAKAVEVIETVAELTREIAESDPSGKLMKKEEELRKKIETQRR